MATFDPFTEQILGLREQQALAQKLREQGMQAPEGQTVSGVYVAPRNTQYLAQALKTYLGGQDVQQAQQGIKDLMAQRQAENAAFLSGMPKATETQVEVRTPEMMNQMGPSPLSRALRVNPSVEEQLAYAAKAPGINPVDVGNLAVKGAELQAGREAHIAEAQLKAQERAQELAQRQADREREQAQRQQDRLDQMKFAASMRPPAPEPLVAVLGPDDRPIMLPRSQAGGMTPANAQTLGATSPQQRIRDARDAMDILIQAAPLVNKSTSSGIGRAADIAAGWVGYSPESADVAADLGVLGGALVSKMPKMSGPQSDKDVALYKEMAGKLGDSTVPASQKRNAMQTLMDLQAKYAGTTPEKLNFEGKVKTASDILNQADSIIGGGK
jgi:hypothetical protein